ncbi:hypothetical protein RJ639_045282 [Escallonia herrerae]|uniref:FMN hydroxy acid dehydrogenase domain-containing protein n=1 Tax=Escallonia herrerae TaxID=1293975 RepID=A0AA88W955_9ASTE|nr:hypothetical protein RJ639_045282 [Escallonia herrerae]
MVKHSKILIIGVRVTFEVSWWKLVPSLVTQRSSSLETVLSRILPNPTPSKDSRTQCHFFAGFSMYLAFSSAMTAVDLLGKGWRLVVIGSGYCASGGWGWGRGGGLIDVRMQGDLNDYKSLVKAVKQVDVVISAVGHDQLADQLKIIAAIKEDGNVKRFLPSEFGLDPGHTNAVEPTKTMLEAEAQIQRAIEAEGFPYTLSQAQGKLTFTSYTFRPVIYTKEDDIATFTIRAVNDPRTLNKSLKVRAPANIYSFNELVSLWERKIGKTLERIYVPEEQVLKNIQEASGLAKLMLSIDYYVYIKGVVVAVQGKIPIFLDGGIRRGTDVFKDLALDAQAVLIGRLIIYGLAAKGEHGVRRIIQMLKDELELTMALSDLARSHVRREHERLQSRIYFFLRLLHERIDHLQCPHACLPAVAGRIPLVAFVLLEECSYLALVQAIFPLMRTCTVEAFSSKPSMSLVVTRITPLVTFSMLLLPYVMAAMSLVPTPLIIDMAEQSKILIIGGTGYIGSFIVEASAKSGHPTFVLVRDSTLSNPSKSNTIQRFKNSGVTFLQGDLSDYKSLVKAVKQVDVVISAVSHDQSADQLNIIAAIKEAGNVKRFLPSEFGLDADRTNAVEPTKTMLEAKARIRRAIEAEGIPYTYVLPNFFAGYFIPTLSQPGATAPPRDKVVIPGDGNTKAIYTKEDDIATFTIRAVNDPRTLNKSLYIRAPANIYSLNELVSLWEKKIGKTLERIYVPEEQVLKNIQEAPDSAKLLLSNGHCVYIKGDQTNFEIEPTFGVEASQLYPDVSYTTVDDYLDRRVTVIHTLQVHRRICDATNGAHGLRAQLRASWTTGFVGLVAVESQRLMANRYAEVIQQPVMVKYSLAAVVAAAVAVVAAAAATATVAVVVVAAAAAVAAADAAVGSCKGDSFPSSTLAGPLAPSLFAASD